jgi:hypothetical protein
MNFDNINTENINRQSIITRRMTRCCSFCRLKGHNINKCNSDRLLEFEVICADIVKNINTKMEFKNWLIENYNNDSLLIKAFAIRKTRVSTNNISIYMDLITEYIFTTYKNNLQLEEENLEENIDIYDNYIENDLLNLLFQIRNNYIIESLQEALIHQNMERMLQIEMAIAYLFNPYTNLNNVNNERNINNIIISRKNLINCTLHKNEKDNFNEICNCSICYDIINLNKFVILDCNHEFCDNCIIKTLQMNKNIIPCCALCRAEIKNIKTRTLEINAKIIETI